jgi:hypothetical protein
MIWLLLVVYQIKHFVADYLLQGRYMLGKFKPYPHFILPLLLHGLVHGVFTFLIALTLQSWQFALFLGFLDMAIHSVVDWAKANPSIGGRYVALSKNEMRQIIENAEYFKEYPLSTTTLQAKPQDDAKLKSNKYFWWALGLDQKAHHLTHYLLIWLML